MYLLKKNNYLTNQLYTKTVFTRLLIISSLILTIYSATLFAEETYPECFPIESSWENIELETVNLSDNQKPKIKLGEHSVILTFNKFENYLPQFYGFAFLKKDIDKIPEITERSSFEEQFRGVKLVALDKKVIAVPDDGTKSYQFTPPNGGKWVIYLVAAINKIPYLDQKQLRITPNVENIRGGSIFSGSSLNLVEPIDFKACVIQIDS